MPRRNWRLDLEPQMNVPKYTIFCCCKRGHVYTTFMWFRACLWDPPLPFWGNMVVYICFDFERPPPSCCRRCFSRLTADVVMFFRKTRVLMSRPGTTKCMCTYATFNFGERCANLRWKLSWNVEHASGNPVTALVVQGGLCCWILTGHRYRAVAALDS